MCTKWSYAQNMCEVLGLHQPTLTTPHPNLSRWNAPYPHPHPPPLQKKTLQNFLDTPFLTPNLCSWFLINWDTMPCIVCKDTLIIYNISCTSHVTKMCNDLATPKFNIFFILRAKLLQYHTWLASQENWRIITVNQNKWI